MADLLKTWNKAQAPQDAVSLGLAHNRIKRFFHRRRDAYLENLAKEKGKQCADGFVAAVSFWLHT